VPVGKVVRLQVTAADVLHSFALPSLGQKLDAIPGRLNETWFRADREGVYHGQCSELCGNGHPYMPITMRVVSEQDYAAWLTEAKQKYASTAAAAKLADAQ
jgi:cytochrome c oxidase subunit 2